MALRPRYEGGLSRPGALGTEGKTSNARKAVISGKVVVLEERMQGRAVLLIVGDAIEQRVAMLWRADGGKGWVSGCRYSPRFVPSQLQCINLCTVNT
jgi:hypothetical protein